MTGHRASHASFPSDNAELSRVIEQVFTVVEEVLHAASGGTVGDTDEPKLAPSLLTLLADGTDQLAAQQAVARDWKLTVPLPFGRALNAAINAGTATSEQARAILKGQPANAPEIAARISAISTLAKRARVFELADRDTRLTELMLTALDNPKDLSAQHTFASETGHSASLAGRVMIEHCDLLVAVWDGQSTANIGGTGHTVLRALQSGLPVLWIAPSYPGAWRLVSSPEELHASADVASIAEEGKAMDELRKAIAQLVAASQPLGESKAGDLASRVGQWRDKSRVTSHAFRRVEALFGQSGSRRFASVRQTFERPEDIAEGSGKALLDATASLTPGNDTMKERISEQILTRFAWLDGISAHLSNRHRSGMVLNFILGAGAIVFGILYLPLVDPAYKWVFASIELLLLLLIVVNTAAGRRLNLHARWLETRRAAEYLRHSPLLAATGVGRLRSDWPQGANSQWPEQYARNITRSVGLPEATVDSDYLRKAIKALRDHHVVPQRDYHAHKSAYLDRIHHGLDHLSERLFTGAIVLVGLFLCLTLAERLGWFDPVLLSSLAKWFTVLAVALPTLGGSFAGIRYFGDFERFAEISQVTSQTLDTVATRIERLLEDPQGAITYDTVAEIVRASDKIVLDEIQSWQSVFRTKIIAVPA